MGQQQTTHGMDEQAAEAERHAYNAAFDELGLAWQWTARDYASLPTQGAERIRTYLQREQAHLLRAYDASFLVDAIEAAKARHLCAASQIPRALVPQVFA